MTQQNWLEHAKKAQDAQHGHSVSAPMYHALFAHLCRHSDTNDPVFNNLVFGVNGIVAALRGGIMTLSRECFDRGWNGVEHNMGLPSWAHCQANVRGTVAPLDDREYSDGIKRDLNAILGSDDTKEIGACYKWLAMGGSAHLDSHAGAQEAPRRAIVFKSTQADKAMVSSTICIDATVGIEEPYPSLLVRFEKVSK